MHVDQFCHTCWFSDGFHTTDLLFADQFNGLKNSVLNFILILKKGEEAKMDSSMATKFQSTSKEHLILTLKSNSVKEEKKNVEGKDNSVGDQKSGTGEDTNFGTEDKSVKSVSANDNLEKNNSKTEKKVNDKRNAKDLSGVLLEFT